MPRRKPLEIVGAAPEGVTEIQGEINPKVVAYIRVSTSDGRQALSPEVQIQVIQEYCRLYSLGAPEIHREEASAKSLRGRPVLLKILEMCRAGQVKDVIVQDTTRLFRDVREALNVFAEMEDEFGVRFHSATGMGMDPSSADGEFMRTLGLALGRRERRLLGERISRVVQATKKVPQEKASLSPAMAEKVRTGKLLTGGAPTGYRWGQGQKGKRNLIRCKKYYPLVQMIAQLHRDGMNLSAIARKLVLDWDDEKNCRRWPRPPTGGDWRQSGIAKIVRRERAGEPDYIPGFNPQPHSLLHQKKLAAKAKAQ
jgi:DNA invertase Pin-like site-specific DNA recombinase